MRRLGFSPGTILDVGAADGTVEIYRHFPESRILAIEPVGEFADALKRLQTRYRIEHVPVAVSDQPGDRQIVVTPSRDGAFLKHADSGEESGDERSVVTTTLDLIARQHRAGGPYLLKIDVQGAEHDVLCGAHEALRETEIAIIECSIFRFRPRQPLVHETIALMAGLGFVVYGFADPRNRPLDGALGQLDMIFARCDSDLWSDHRYATPEQVTRHARSWPARLKQRVS